MENLGAFTERKEIIGIWELLVASVSGNKVKSFFVFYFLFKFEMPVRSKWRGEEEIGCLIEENNRTGDLGLITHRYYLKP